MELDDLKVKAIAPVKFIKPTISFINLMIRGFFYIVVTFAVCMWIYGTWAEPSPLSYQTPTKLVDANKVYHPGDMVPLRLNRCNTSTDRIYYSLMRAFRNVDTDDVIIIESTELAKSPGCAEAVSELYKIPLSAQPGTYVAIGVAKVPGMIRTHSVEMTSEQFQVAPTPPVAVVAPSAKYIIVPAGTQAIAIPGVVPANTPPGIYKIARPQDGG